MRRLGLSTLRWALPHDGWRLAQRDVSLSTAGAIAMSAFEIQTLKFWDNASLQGGRVVTPSTEQALNGVWAEIKAKQPAKPAPRPRGRPSKASLLAGAKARLEELMKVLAALRQHHQLEDDWPRAVWTRWARAMNGEADPVHNDFAAALGQRPAGRKRQRLEAKPAPDLRAERTAAWREEHDRIEQELTLEQLERDVCGVVEDTWSYMQRKWPMRPRLDRIQERIDALWARFADGRSGRQE